MLPLLSACISGIFGRRVGSKGVIFLSIFCIFLSFCCSLFCFYETIFCRCAVFICVGSWIDLELINVDWGFMFDHLTSIMCCIVSFISTLVHVYSIEYMATDPHLSRFMSYLSLFTFFMLILVTSDNFVQMFLGWEGVGLCSYLLINFWYTRIQANKAAIKAMVINRIGDLGLIFGIFLIFSTFKSTDYSTVFALVPLMSENFILFLTFKINVLDIICLFFFIGAVGKSAQLGLHTWLPDAMEGPTPVSALIHAATMVTAGVFLLIRCSCLLEHCGYTRDLITLVGASTAFFAATVGLVQNDLKKVIAYSTCSQLGYMIFSCGLSVYSVSIYHLSNHAFFKALLFLSAGSIIHAVGDEQDMRKLGGLKNLLPYTYSVMLIGSLALAGFPFLSGFYSKDLILEAAFGSYTYVGHYSYYLGVFSAFLTAFYSVRLLVLTFFVKPCGFRSVYAHVSEASFFICTVLGILVIPSVFIGFYSKDLLVGVGSSSWLNCIYVAPQNLSSLDGEFIPFFFKTLPFYSSISGISFCLILYTCYAHHLFSFKVSRSGRVLYSFLNKKWYIDKFYAEFFAQSTLDLSYTITYKFLDRGVFEMLGPYGIVCFIHNFSNYTYNLQTGRLSNYVYFFLAFLLISFVGYSLFFVTICVGLTQQVFFLNFLKFIFLFILSGMLLFLFLSSKRLGRYFFTVTIRVQIPLRTLLPINNLYK